MHLLLEGANELATHVILSTISWNNYVSKDRGIRNLGNYLFTLLYVSYKTNVTGII